MTSRKKYYGLSIYETKVATAYKKTIIEWLRIMLRILANVLEIIATF
jgi:hypothetical protein